jgi:hypothetical protein
MRTQDLYLNKLTRIGGAGRMMLTSVAASKPCKPRLPPFMLWCYGADGTAL